MVNLLSTQLVYAAGSVIFRVTTCLEDLEMSGNLSAVREMSGNLRKIREMLGRNLVREKLPKTVYCKLHICVHTGILYYDMSNT